LKEISCENDHFEEIQGCIEKMISVDFHQIPTSQFLDRSKIPL
jgi:hypothetical protein